MDTNNIHSTISACFWILLVFGALIQGITLKTPSVIETRVAQMKTLITEQGKYERKLLADLGLYENNENIGDGVTYNKYERPVFNESDALIVKFGLVLAQIIDLDEKNQILVTNVWLNMIWNDYGLVWNESDYGGVKSIRLPPSMVWTPDILMYNSADEDINSIYETNVVISSNGDCLWVPLGLFFSTCKINIAWFPFDDQECNMKFGSWTYDSSGIDLELQNDYADTSGFSPSGEWQLLEMPGSRNVKSYDCCPEKYVDVTFTLKIRRRTLYYGFNLIIPCVLISSMALLSFTLPPDSGEKISLGVTVLLSLTVFLLIVAEIIPPTSDAVPLIGIYFAFIMLMCSLSVLFTVLVLNYHHRTPSTHAMPIWVRVLICEWLAWIMRMERPGKKVTFKELRKSIEKLKSRNAIEPQSSILYKRELSASPGKKLPNGNGAVSIDKLLLENSASMSRELSSEISNDRLTTNTTTARPLRCSPSPKTTQYSPVDNHVVGSPSVGFARTVDIDIIDETHCKIANNTKHLNDSKLSSLSSRDKLLKAELDNSRNLLLHIKRRGTQSAESSPAHYDRRNHKSQSDLQRSSQTLSTVTTLSKLNPILQSTDGSRSRETSSSEGSKTDPRVYELLQDILTELRDITEKGRMNEANDELCNDWKFAAMVVDRVCLFLFTGMTVASTFGILFSSTHISA